MTLTLQSLLSTLMAKKVWIRNGTSNNPVYYTEGNGFDTSHQGYPSDWQDTLPYIQYYPSDAHIQYMRDQNTPEWDILAETGEKFSTVWEKYHKVDMTKADMIEAYNTHLAAWHVIHPPRTSKYFS